MLARGPHHIDLLNFQPNRKTATVLSAEWATVLFVIQLSLGEAIWSPRWYDYSMSVAPEGREGVFTAMASAPLFLGKFVTGEYIVGVWSWSVAIQ